MKWYGKLIGAVIGWMLLRHPAGIQPIAGTTHPERLIASCAGDSPRRSSSSASGSRIDTGRSRSGKTPISAVS